MFGRELKLKFTTIKIRPVSFLRIASLQTMKLLDQILLSLPRLLQDSFAVIMRQYRIEKSGKKEKREENEILMSLLKCHLSPKVTPR